MKIRAALLASLVGLWAAPVLPAQVPLEAKSNGSNAVDPHPVAVDQSKRILDELNEEERQQFREAVNQVWHAEEVERRRKAMYEANLAYRKALQQEVRDLKVSKKVRSVLLRLMHLRFKQEGKVPDGVAPNSSDRNGAKPRALPYTKEDQAVITAARLKAEKTPAVIAAKLKLNQAVTARERNAAAGDFRVAMRAAMEATDPRVKQLFNRRDRPAPNDRRRPPERR